MIQTRSAARWRSSPVVYGPGPVAWLGLLALAAFFLFLFVSVLMPFQAIGTGALLLICAVVVAVALRPFGAAIALVIGGSVHQFAMLLLLHFTHTATLVKIAQLWKEGVVLLLLALALHYAFERGQAPHVYALDLAIVMFMLLGVFYLAFPNLADSSNSFVTKIYGLRLDAFALLAYFAGRGLPWTRANVRNLLVVLAVVVSVIAAIAVVEFALPSMAIGVLNNLGQQDFARQLGDPTQTSDLRFNTLGAAVIPRASSLLLSDLGLAFYMLLGVPLIAALYLTRGSGSAARLWLNVLLLLSMAATVLTLTRSAWFALITILVAGTLASRRYRRAFWVLLEVGAAAVVALVAFRILPTLLTMMFSATEGSLHAHIGALQASVELIRENPLGLGLGSAGPVSQRFDVAGGITNESWYFQIATELGIPGMLLWVAVTGLFVLMAYRRYRQVTDPWLKTVCLTMFGSMLAFAQVSLTLHAWSGLATSIIVWFLAGIVVQAHEIERREPASRDLALADHGPFDNVGASLRPGG